MAGNETFISGKLVLSNEEAMLLPKLASDPVTAVAGDLYYNTTLNTVRMYNGSSWASFTTGSVSLTGQSLGEFNTIVGNSSSLSDVVDTNTLGDIKISTTNGAAIKTGVVSNTHISSSAAITRSKLASGTVNRVVVNDGSGVLSDAAAILANKALISDANGIPTHSTTSSTELGYVTGVTSAIQTQLDAKALDAAVIKKDGSVAFTGNQSMGNNKLTNLSAPTTNGDALRYDQLGAASGIATLDSGGKVPVSQLPNSVVEFQGNWNATTNSPTLVDGTGNIGDVYRVNVAGTQDLGSGSQTFVVGDWVIYDASDIWQKSHAGADAVLSVNGAAGVVTVNAINQLTGDVTTSAASSSQSEVATIAAGAVTGTKIASNTITDTNISSSAAITRSKLASGTAYRVLANNSSGVISENAALTASKVVTSDTNGQLVSSTTSSTELGYVTGVTSAIQTQLDAKATKALDNLASTAVNADILPGTTNSINLGSSTKAYANVESRKVSIQDSAASFATEITSIKTSIPANQSSALTVLTFSAATYVSGTVDYEVVESVSGNARSGTIKLAVNSVANTVGFNDVYTQSEVIGNGISFTASSSAGTVVLQVSGTSTNTAVFKASARLILV